MENTLGKKLLKLKMLVNGKLVDSHSKKRIYSINPTNEEIIGSIPLANKIDVDEAVQAAKNAFPLWASLSVGQRASYLRTIANKIRERKEEIAEIEAKDSGNTIKMVRGDVEKSAATLEYYAGLGYEITGKTVPGQPGNLHLSTREPYGVVGRIVAFNHPFLFCAARMAAPLMAGNTLVIKPAEQSPLSAGILSEILHDILPPGVVNIVNGDGEVGEAIVTNPDVLRIAFTGSVATGLKIQQSILNTGRIKNVTFELGGKNPFILFPDADWGKAVAATIEGMNFNWQGQSCGSTSRLMIHESIYEETVEEIRRRVANIRVGNPLDEETEMGPINSKAHYNRIKYFINEGIKENATLIYGGQSLEYMEKGYWIQPTVFADVKPSMKIAKEEIFGPVLSIMKWKDEDEVIKMANDSDYGLTAAIWTQNVQTAVRVSQKLENGYVWVNGTSKHYPQLPFGGYKQSGLGREEGIEELNSYTQLKSIHFIQ